MRLCTGPRELLPELFALHAGAWLLPRRSVPDPYEGRRAGRHALTQSAAPFQFHDEPMMAGSDRSVLPVAPHFPPTSLCAPQYRQGADAEGLGRGEQGLGHVSEEVHGTHRAADAGPRCLRRQGLLDHG